MQSNLLQKRVSDVEAYLYAIITSIVSGILVFLLQNTIKENKKLRREREEIQRKYDTAMRNGMVCVLRKHLMDDHELWISKGYITSHALENGLAMYRAYKDLGGNGMIDHMEEEIQQLPIKD
jgi:DNA mismatch repair ATPase MutS